MADELDIAVRAYTGAKTPPITASNPSKKTKRAAGTTDRFPEHVLIFD